ncbi:MAG: glycine oxidase ThiO [Candidatus Methylumidiphilus sp.]
MNRTDVIIIGGGVSGLMCARELATSGATVAVLERQALARESSWAGGGILSPLSPWRVPKAVTALCRWSQAAYPQFAAELQRDTGIDPEWLPSGLLFNACEDLDLALRWAQAEGRPCQQLPASGVASLAPKIQASGQSLLLPDVGQVRNPRLLRALRQDLARRGVKLLEHHAIEGVIVKHGVAGGVVCRQETLRADTYVLAAGAWSGLLAAGAGLAPPPVAPVKGEMIVFDAPPGLLEPIVLSQGRYLIPRKDGRILAGSTVENAQFNKSATDAARETLRSFACGLLPALGLCRIEKHWAGLRPGSPEGIPAIGPHPEAGNLYLNCGHYRNGFVMAPASARLLADHILHRPPIVDPTPYLPSA